MKEKFVVSGTIMGCISFFSTKDKKPMLLAEFQQKMLLG
jgi:hypothetical protein